jgi:uncharacterized protein
MSLKLRKDSIQMIFRIRSRTVTTTTCSAFCLLAASLALSQTHEDFLSTEKAARTGDAGSQFILGSMYAQGRGVQQDYSEAVRWFRKAAEQGLADAQTTLGADYAAGIGVAQDYSEALRWFRKAAAQGNPDGQALLGGAYDAGQGVAQDHAEAARWYREAANQGVAAAQELLGILYAQGQGVPQDYVQAHMWLNLAAAHESGDIQAKRAKIRDSIAAEMTRDQIAEAQRLAREWKPLVKK